MNDQVPDDPIAHCIAKVRELVGRDEPDRRDLLQLGYNLGRLSELTGAGRGPLWDRWKGPVAAWDRPALESLARNLHELLHLPEPRRPDAPPRSPRPGDVRQEKGAGN